jgi:hypothetical protein
MNPISRFAIIALAFVLAACAAGGEAMPSAPEATMPPITPAPTSTPTDPPPTEDPGMTPEPSSATPTPIADALLAVELTDVRSGESFTLGELAADHGPVLVEPMAIWCSNCRAQQREVVRAHELGSFSSVSLDVDLSEAPEDLASYADREGFDWYFAMADAELYRSLQDRFGVAVTNPPSTPLIIIEADGSVRPLEFGRGVRGAEELLDELGAG